MKMFSFQAIQSGVWNQTVYAPLKYSLLVQEYCYIWFAHKGFANPFLLLQNECPDVDTEGGVW